jgi:cytochrome oxidase Cu insertion factor (SCO1/SenC/PrrC family)
VHDALAVQRERPGLVVLVVTLDPWRDTPARLPSIAGSWEMGESAHLLSGAVADVEGVLDAWAIPRSRDVTTGDVTHATFVYLVGRDGRLAWKAPSATSTLLLLLDRL